MLKYSTYKHISFLFPVHSPCVSSFPGLLSLVTPEFTYCYPCVSVFHVFGDKHLRPDKQSRDRSLQTARSVFEKLLITCSFLSKSKTL